MTHLDPSLAKGLSKQFTRQIDTVSFERLKSLGSQFKKKGKSVTKSFNQLSSLFNSERNNFAIHNAEFGSRKNPTIGMTLLQNIDFNSGANRKEDLIGAFQHYITKIPINFIASVGIQFSISTHLIQRMIERHPNIDAFKFDHTFDLVRKELNFVPIYSSIIKAFLFFGVRMNSLPRSLLNSAHSLTFPIPSENGMFISHVQSGVPSLRTFLSTNELNEKQLELRKKMIRLTKRYCSINFPYVIQRIMEEENNQRVPYVLFYLSVIFFDFKELFIDIIPETLGNDFPSGQRKSVLNKLLSFAEVFPGHQPEEDLEDRNTILRKAISDEKELSLLRRWLIEINLITQKNKFLSFH